MNELAKNARKEQEYFKFLNKKLNNINLLLSLNFEKLNIENLRKINEKVYKPIVDENKYLKNDSDDLHRIMSYVAYTAVLLPMNIFSQNTMFVKNKIEFINNAAILIDKCLNNEEKLETLVEFVKNHKIEELKLSTKIRVENIYRVPHIFKIVENADLNSERYLYLTGEYITENEIKLQQYFSKLSEEKINKMADTVVDGFLRGYKAQNLDITKKSFVNVNYPLGCERMARQIGKLLKEQNLDVVYKISSCTQPNRQLAYFHKNNTELYVDETYCEEYLLQTEKAFKAKSKLLGTYGGALWVETFGEKVFEPKPKALYKPTKETKAILNKMQASFAQIYNKYTKSEERSFTIISYPCPDIGENFEELFDETIKINTLDCDKWQKIQQHLIDALDEGSYVQVIGQNGNKTNLRIELQSLSNPKKETLFENCTADVNIPVGEVFTTPQLKGTTGKLYVSQVYLNGLKYTDLEIDVEDGCVVDYNCSMFKKESTNKEFIKENILKNYETLPMGEFAIGTNTLAYVIARKYKIEDKLDILIAEKTGPHFAFGDTCFSHQEDIKTYNPDGKEIIAKENDYSKLRDEDMSKAYFGCHTDITIPFDEIGVIKVVRPDESEIKIIENGLFVLEGTESLNLEAMR